MKKKAQFYPARYDRYLEKSNSDRPGARDGPRRVLVCLKCYRTSNCKCDADRSFLLCLGAIPRHTARNRWKKLIAAYGEGV